MRTDILKRYGIVDRPELAVQPIKEAEVYWRVAISGKGDPIAAIPVERAEKLAKELQGIGETSLAAHIIEAVYAARRSQVQGL
jgi:hypothetical protein